MKLLREMKLVIFGLTISSSWGNGHATLWRGLCRALARAGHRVTFFERDVPYYAGNRDLHELPGGNLILYDQWQDVISRARQELVGADVGMVTSYCPDGLAATALLLDGACGLRVFYDLDTPVTLSRLSRGESVSYIGERGFVDFDLVLSFTGGRALEVLRERLGARLVAPLYGHVDPQVHRPVGALARYCCALSYLGTYAAERQAGLNALFVEPARRRAKQRFLIGGAQYPHDFPWSENIYFVRHLPPSEHPAFFSSSRLTLNVTRPDMAGMGFCPSGRLFEATAAGAAVITDDWEGLEAFFTPGREMLVAHSGSDVVDSLDLADSDISRVAAAGRERTLAEHTSDRRAAELLLLLDAVPGSRATAQVGEA
jgi:spore maturation protein CgeB